MNRLLITDFLSPDVVRSARDMFDVTEQYGSSPDELLKAVSDNDALICRSMTRVNREVIDEGVNGRLKIVVSVTSGMNHIDTDYAAERGLMICNTPWGVTTANAEYNIGVMLALARNFNPASEMMRRGTWDQQRVIGHELEGAQLGIVSFGRIAQKTAKMALAGFGMRVTAYDPYQEEAVFLRAGVRRADLDELLETSDFVVVNAPYTKDTADMISAERIARMRRGAYIVQASRGGVVNEDALIMALEKGHLAGAAIDVFVGEPSIDPRFRELDNVILTPHIACSSLEARERVGHFALEEVQRYLGGRAVESAFIPSPWS